MKDQTKSMFVHFFSLSLVLFFVIYESIQKRRGGCTKKAGENSIPKNCIFLNGSPTEEFNLERGLRQGDPLFPFHFLIAIEGLNVMTKVVVKQGLFSSYGVGPNGDVGISHLQFADDTLLLGDKSWANIRILKAVLMLFEFVSGLKVNFHKSMLYEVNISDSWLHEAVSMLRCKHSKLPLYIWVYLLEAIRGNTFFGTLWLIELKEGCLVGRVVLPLWGVV